MTTKDTSHAGQNARSWSDTLRQMIAALECDYSRLDELREERAAIAADTTNEETPGHLDGWDSEYGAELAELETAATIDGDKMENREEAEQRVQESPLSVQIRSGWVDPGGDMQAEDFDILLSTGGPALRIMGELDEHQQPRRAWLEWQDWGTPWTEFHGEGAASQADLLTFAGCFYFGER